MGKLSIFIFGVADLFRTKVLEKTGSVTPALKPGLTKESSIGL
jgi:hypothetical protein